MEKNHFTTSSIAQYLDSSTQNYIVSYLELHGPLSTAPNVSAMVPTPRKRACDIVDTNPLAVETFGGWGVDVPLFFQAVAGRVADSTFQPRNGCSAALFQELAVRLHRGNADMLLRARPPALRRIWLIIGPR
jgi:hypothetical protein